MAKKSESKVETKETANDTKKEEFQKKLNELLDSSQYSKIQKGIDTGKSFSVSPVPPSSSLFPDLIPPSIRPKAGLSAYRQDTRSEFYSPCRKVPRRCGSLQVQK